MIKTECHLWGVDFSPFQVSQIPEIKIFESNEPKESGKSGRYKNQPIPFGSCQIHTPNTIDSEDRIIWMAQFIKDNVNNFKNAGATNIVMNIKWYGCQGNMELSVEELTKISALNIPLTMVYIFDEEK